jgi:hypothetical protein
MLFIFSVALSVSPAQILRMGLNISSNNPLMPERTTTWSSTNKNFFIGIMIFIKQIINRCVY